MSDERCSACTVKLLPGEAEERDGQLLCATCAAREPGTLTSQTHECRFCEGVFSTPQELSSHIRRTHMKPRSDRGRRGRARRDDGCDEARAHVYGCKKCGRRFSSSQALGGHVVRAHRRRGSPRTHPGREEKPAAVERLFKCRACGAGFGTLAAVSAHGRKAHSSPVIEPSGSTKISSIPCPMCARPLPPWAALVTQEFIREGVEEERAARLTAIAYGLLHVPGRPS